MDLMKIGKVDADPQAWIKRNKKKTRRLHQILKVLECRNVKTKTRAKRRRHLRLSNNIAVTVFK